MNNPSNILSEEDIKLLKSKNIKVPNKKLNDQNWDDFIIEIAIKIEQDDAERIIDLLDDSRSI